MKKYSEFVDIQEHNPMTVRNIVKKVNPLDNLQTRLKRKGLAGAAKETLKKQLDKINPLSGINKARTATNKKDLAALKDTRTSLKNKLAVITPKINKLEDKLYGRKKP